LASDDVLERALSARLIDTKDATLFGAKLYDFRNSVVHAKYDQRNLIFSPSTIPGESEAGLWREPFRQLAWSALEARGRRLG
jgi:hypothetical protein